MQIDMLSVTPWSEKLIETAARTCYQSQDKTKDTPDKMIRALINSGHHSVLEHASATFRISGVSRAMSHQLVRHRLASYSQQSQRYVKEDQFEYVIPESISERDVKIFEHDMLMIQEMYDRWKHHGLKNEDARFVLPNACCTEIVMTANFREWRQIFEVRCDEHAQWEIRKAMTHCLMLLNKEAPNTFFDYAEKYLTELSDI